MAVSIDNPCRSAPFWIESVSITYNSPLYEKYNFNPKAKNFLRKVWNINQFWPQVLAELGIVGVVCFIGFFTSLSIALLMLKHKASSDEMKGLLTGLITYIVVLSCIN